MNKLLETNELASWFIYPSEFEKIVNQNLLDFDPWIIMTGERLKIRYKGIKKRYPKRDLIPFARREDNDDVACWEKGMEQKIIVIHDFSTPGYETKEVFQSFHHWLNSVITTTLSH